MYQPFTTELANQHRNELLHEAETYRLTKTSHAARSSERRAMLRRVVASTVAVLWRIRH